MNEIVTIEQTRKIMGRNFVGPEELNKIKFFKSEQLNVPEIPYTETELKQKSEDYLLILGIEYFDDGSAVTIRNLKDKYGMNPEQAEPCFYNQDWYDKETFIDIPMKNEWFFIRKNVYEESRSVQPTELIKQYRFPTAIKCTYAFFVAWISCDIKLWWHDFVWCSDVDHNGDRIYVGKYNDVDGINKNGFSIHRHLALRPCYGSID